MSNRRKAEYINGCLSESKVFAKLMRERRLRERKAYKGRRFRYKSDQAINEAIGKLFEKE